MFYSMEFMTRSLPCFTMLRNKFYSGRVKMVPLDMYDYINYESMAHMMMGDGSLKKGGGTMLNLQSFTVKELVTLINVFKMKFDLDCTLHYSM
ncbi:intron-encoded DNA endonuclease aI5 alpha (mitochondrion) [Martiniozyma asiatica (nom. inval.)]|nr:intron-encoded DNA endonuclease aI5 alpha [Martiniozyma asiatica]